MPHSNARHNLTSLQIAELFAIANDDPNASKRRHVHGKRIEPITEGERVKAVNELLREFRSQLEQLAEAKASLASQRTMNEFPPLRAATPKGAKPATAKAVKVGSEQRRQPERGKPVQVDPFLMQCIKDWGLRIFAKRDPVLALESLLGLRHPRGKRAKNTERDFQIAVEVLETRKRMSLEEKKRVSLERAAEAVAQKYELECEYVLKLYKQNRLPARAEIALRADRS
jgi:hypothetical protein